MSIENLFIPNNYDLFCNSITGTQGGGFVTLNGVQILTNKTITGGNLVGCTIRSSLGSNYITLGTQNLTSGSKNFNFPNTANDNSFFVMSAGSGINISQPLTFTSNPTISQIINIGLLTLPSSTDTLVARDTTDILTQKTIDSGNNSILITSGSLIGFNINSLINQDVRTSGTPSFSGESLLLGSTKTLQRFPLSSSVPANTAATIFGITLATGQCVVIKMQIALTCLSGANTGYGDYLFDWKAVNNAGTITSSNGINQSISEANIAGAFTGKLAPTISVTGTSVSVILTSTLATGSINFGGTIDVYFSS